MYFSYVFIFSCAFFRNEYIKNFINKQPSEAEVIYDGRIFGKVNLVSNNLVSNILVSNNLVSDNLVSNKNNILVSDNLVSNESQHRYKKFANSKEENSQFPLLEIFQQFSPEAGFPPLE